MILFLLLLLCTGILLLGLWRKKFLAKPWFWENNIICTSSNFISVYARRNFPIEKIRETAWLENPQVLLLHSFLKIQAAGSNSSSWIFYFGSAARQFTADTSFRVQYIRYTQRIQFIQLSSVNTTVRYFICLEDLVDS